MAFRLATMNGRAALIADDGVYDLERHSRGRFAADPMQAIARHAELHAVAAALQGAPDAALARRRARRLRPAAAEGLRHRPQLPFACVGVGRGAAADAAGVHEVSQLPRRTDE